MNVFASQDPVNSPEYWDERFSSGDWESSGGRLQTRQFAERQVQIIDIPRDFTGSILDFGCGLGDAFPVYRGSWPLATLTGVDISASAVDQCRLRYGSLGEFRVADHLSVPEADVIIVSNVLEHLPNHEEVAATLFGRCRRLYVIVPYAEVLGVGGEHVNSYRADSFPALGPRTTKVFLCPGWSQFGMDLVRLYRKNLSRLLHRKPLRRRGRQILFRFERLPIVQPPSLGSRGPTPGGNPLGTGTGTEMARTAREDGD